MMEIKIKYLRDILPIEIIEKGNWIDLRAAEKTYLYGHQFKMIPLGIAVELPEGYEAIVAPRSSTFKNHGVLLANSIGIIDESYKGENDEWHFPAFATRDTLIEKNERICQFRIVEHQPQVSLVTVEHLNNPDRNGLGSTGRM